MSKRQNELNKFWQELIRRKVIGVVIVYATTAFILMQLAPLLEESLNLPLWFDTLVTILLIIGFPIIVIFSWVFDVSSKGIQKTDSNEPESINNVTPVAIINSVAPDKSIIVLPFENMSPEPDQEYFSDGLTEEIITDLSYVHGLLVISRSSAMTFKGAKNTIKDIAGKVNVRYVLEGSVRKAGNNLRITAQLIDAKSDTHIWAEKYSGNLDDIFDIQEKVSRSITDSLKLKLSVGEIEKISEHKIENFQVYECYLKSRQDLWKYTEESLKRAEQNLKNGLHLFGDHELLLAGLGQVYFQFYDSGINQDKEYLNKVEECANKILKIDPISASAYQLSGLLKMKRENALSAFRDFQKSFDLNPSDPETLLWMIYILCFHIGRPSKAIPFIEKVLEIDPLTPTNQSLPAIYQWMEGRFEKSLFHFNKWVEMEPDSVVANWYLGQLLLINKKKEAFNFIEGIWQNNPDGFFSILLRLLKYALDGRIKETLQLINEEVRQVAWNDFHLSWYIADCYALIEEKEQAIKWLEHAFEWGLINYPLLSEIDPFLENIRSEPRFKKLMKKVKNEWENFKV